MRKLVTIRQIESVEKHSNADTLDVLQIDGWQCVSRSGTFKPGDQCVYLEIDSFVPVDSEPFKFMEKSKISWDGNEGARIKTIKLRGEISQGLALPFSDFSKEQQIYLRKNIANGNDPECEIVDFASYLNIKKWERSLPEEKAKLGGSTKGHFPSFVPKTDEVRIQNIWKEFGNSTESYKIEYTNPETNEKVVVERPYRRFKDDEYEVSIKMDGCSMTAYINNGIFGVCSRNLEVKDDGRIAYWQLAKEAKLEESMRSIHDSSKINFAIQGELCGPGINGNNEKLDHLKLFVFNIWDIDEQKYLSPEDRIEILDKFADLQYVDSIPILEYRQFDFETIQEALKYADGPSWNGNSKREGLVFKSCSEPRNHFKIVSNEYLLKHGDR